MKYAALLQWGDLGTESPSYVTTRVRSTFELMLSECRGEGPNLFFRGACRFKRWAGSTSRDLPRFAP